jgi:hypothetical protein
MSEKKDEQTAVSNNNWPNSADAKAAEIIRNFTLFYPPDAAKEALWQLFNAGMSGTGADYWNACDRSNMLLFYRLAGELVEVLPGLLPQQNQPS